jgi:hypothetical protein
MIGKGVARGRYTVKNQEKYAGTKSPIYRSSWEQVFMTFCDNNPGVISWASEAIRIPYRNPLTGKRSTYVPDFFVQYQDKNGNKRSEVVEIKPSNQSTMEGAGKSKNRQMAVVQNMAKWEAATAWCKQKGLKFRVVTENDLFHQGKRRG